MGVNMIEMCPLPKPKITESDVDMDESNLSVTYTDPNDRNEIFEFPAERPEPLFINSKWEEEEELI